MNSIAVYLGSAAGKDPSYMSSAYRFGQMMAEHGIKIIYGGSGVGTMGALADGVLSRGGEIIGIFPRGFAGKRAIAARGIKVDRMDLSDLIFVRDFSERKKMMEEMSDCAVALPGGYGTMDELFEYAVGNEIGRHLKPVYVLNENGFYDGLKALVSRMCAEGFLPDDDPILTFYDTLEDLVNTILA